MDIAQFNAAHREPPTRRDALEAIYSAAHWLLTEERVAEAARVFRTLIQADPADERGWLGLGQCHEHIDQPRIAAELFHAGSAVTRSPVRCLVARARILARQGEQDSAEGLLDDAERAALEEGDHGLVELVANERQAGSR